MLTDTKTLIARFECQAHRMGELWERCQGKVWPKAESAEFTALRDERLPAMRAALEANAQQAEPAIQTMTAHRAAYFMKRFLHEEKMLGPNEQAALKFTIEALEAQQAEAQEPCGHFLQSDAGWWVQCKAAASYTVPLYTAQPKAVPLTKQMQRLSMEELEAIFQCGGDVYTNVQSALAAKNGMELADASAKKGSE